MLTPATLALEIPQGADFSLPLRWQAGDPLAPVDLTGCDLHMVITPSNGGTPIDLTITSGHAILTDAVDGKFTITIPADETAVFAWKRGFYILNVQFADDSTLMVLRGPVVVLSSIEP